MQTIFNTYIDLPALYYAQFKGSVQAIRNNDLARLKEILNEHPHLVSYLDPTGDFIVARGSNLLQYVLTKPELYDCFDIILAKTLELKLDLDYIVSNKLLFIHHTPLMLSIKTGAYYQAIKLLQAGANPDSTTEVGKFSALHLLLFKATLPKNPSDQTIKSYDEASGYLKKLIEAFKSTGANFKAKDEFGNQPLDMLNISFHRLDNYSYVVNGELKNYSEFVKILLDNSHANSNQIDDLIYNVINKPEFHLHNIHGVIFALIHRTANKLYTAIYANLGHYKNNDGYSLTEQIEKKYLQQNNLQAQELSKQLLTTLKESIPEIFGTPAHKNAYTSYVSLPSEHNEQFKELVQTINDNNLDALKQILNDHPHLVSYLDPTGDFIVARGSNLLQYVLTKPELCDCFDIILTKTLELKLDLNYIVSNNLYYIHHTPLMLSIKTGAYYQAIKLLQAGANPNSTTKVGKFSALHLLFFKTTLPEDPFDQTIKDYDEVGGYLKELIEAFRSAGADFEAKDEFGNQPLDMLSKEFHPLNMYTYRLNKKWINYDEFKQILLDSHVQPEDVDSSIERAIANMRGSGDNYIGKIRFVISIGTPNELLKALQANLKNYKDDFNQLIVNKFQNPSYQDAYGQNFYKKLFDILQKIFPELYNSSKYKFNLTKYFIDYDDKTIEADFKKLVISENSEISKFSNDDKTIEADFKKLAISENSEISRFSNDDKTIEADFKKLAISENSEISKFSNDDKTIEADFKKLAISENSEISKFSNDDEPFEMPINGDIFTFIPHQ